MAKPYAQVNEVQSTIATGNTWTRGTDTSIVLTDASDFDSGGGYIRIGNTTSFALMEYTGKTSNTLTGLTVCTLGVVVSSGDEMKEWPAGTEVSRVLMAEETNDMLSQAGGSNWSNRTHKGWETLETATTYSVGAGQTFANLYEAANELQGLILADHLTLEFQGNVTENDAGVDFKNILSAGGRLFVDLNGYTWTYAPTGTASRTPLRFIMPACVEIGGGTISYNATTPAAYTDIITVQNLIYLQLPSYISGMTTLTINANSKAIRSLLWVECSRFLWRGVTESNVGSVTQILSVVAAANGGAYNSNPSSQYVSSGGIFIQTDGTVITS